MQPLSDQTAKTCSRIPTDPAIVSFITLVVEKVLALITGGDGHSFHCSECLQASPQPVLTLHPTCRSFQLYGNVVELLLLPPLQKIFGFTPVACDTEDELADIYAEFLSSQWITDCSDPFLLNIHRLFLVAWLA